MTLLLAGGYAYVASRLASGLGAHIALAIPFLLVWVVPVVYWNRRSEGEESRAVDLAHQASYLSMAWVSFVFAFTVLRDLALLATSVPVLGAVHRAVVQDGSGTVVAASFLALLAGAASARRGPGVKEVLLRVAGLHPDLQGLRIAQISDLHVGRHIQRSYVERVVERVRELAPDLVVLTGDIVDGPVERLAPDVEPLAGLASTGPAYFVLGNHDCYSGAGEWIAHFRTLGMRVLLNESTEFRKGTATLVVGGVVDPAYRAARPDISLDRAQPADFRLLLAHNPKLAPLGARAGFDLQLSGHTHAGQFFPWTLAVRLVHAPHVAGLSREGGMQVYVSAGTGSWGPPVRLGTRTEITLVRLVAA